MLLWRYHRQIAEQSSFQFDQNTLKKKALFSQPSWVQHNSRNSVQFSHSVMSYSLRPHGLQHGQASLSITNSQSLLDSVITIQPSHPVSSHSPPTFNLSHNQGLFKWVSSSHQVAKVLEFSASASVHPMNTQDWSFRWTVWISLLSKGHSRVFSNTTVQKHQFFGAQLSL